MADKSNEHALLETWFLDKMKRTMVYFCLSFLSTRSKFSICSRNGHVVVASGSIELYTCTTKDIDGIRTWGGFTRVSGLVQARYLGSIIFL